MAKIPIYGTLSNETPEGKLAVAEQIFDETEGKKQSEINSETVRTTEQMLEETEKEQVKKNIGLPIYAYFNDSSAEEQKKSGVSIDFRIFQDDTKNQVGNASIALGALNKNMGVMSVTLGYQNVTSDGFGEGMGMMPGSFFMGSMLSDHDNDTFSAIGYRNNAVYKDGPVGKRVGSYLTISVPYPYEHDIYGKNLVVFGADENLYIHGIGGYDGGSLNGEAPILAEHKSLQEVLKDLETRVPKAIDSKIDEESTNPVENKAIAGALKAIDFSAINAIVPIKWTNDVATTRKSIPEVARKSGLKISYTNASKVYIVEQYIGNAFDDANWSDNGNWKGCRTPLTPLFEARGAAFNDETGYYELNGYTDISEGEMLTIYKCSTVNIINNNTLNPNFYDYFSEKLRTNLPFWYSTAASINLSYAFRLVDIETIKISAVSEKVIAYNIQHFVGYNLNTKKVLDRIELANSYTADIVISAKVIEELNIYKLKQNIDIQYTPFLKYSCFLVMVNNAANTKPITVTVHPTTYSYLMGTAEPTEQVGGTTEEWQALVTIAAEKQISFATTE